MGRPLWGSEATEERPRSGLLTASGARRWQAAQLQSLSKGANPWHAESAGARHSALISKPFGSLLAKSSSGGGIVYTAPRALRT